MTNLDKLKGLTTAKTFSKGTVIINEGDTTPYNMYIVLQGTVAVYKKFRQFGETSLAVLGPGNFFGEMSLFLQRPRSATVVSKEETVTLEINQSNFHKIIAEFPDVAYTLMQTLCSRLPDEEKEKAGLLPKE